MKDEKDAKGLGWRMPGPENSQAQRSRAGKEPSGDLGKMTSALVFSPVKW